MEIGIETFTDLLEAVADVAQVIAAGAIFIAALSYTLNRKQLNFDVITSCTARWQEIMPDLERAQKEGERRVEVDERYVDLCNEELFYFIEGYLPKEVIREWLTGMVLYLPHYHSEVQDENLKEAFNKMVPSVRFKGYPRVEVIFDLDRAYNPIEEREEVVREIEKRIEDFSRRSRLPWLLRLRNITQQPDRRG